MSQQSEVLEEATGDEVPVETSMARYFQQGAGKVPVISYQVLRYQYQGSGSANRELRVVWYRF